ncbi:Gfo/Idh/MocA family protein [Novipirellula artificiosorum]|uniref:Putative oxidoreductase YteT n=1 Tax=Novipirellula artificiosorum TaxID=2528016 RepID=A0A5C6D7X4_9BACT|nr:Gfo/Idh/MocA family oxidoreductase [Novipirellula artificiosorum]TWU31817.1 putative oxidoreductase YteT precursor [Novipirellula artificiosorum]
MTTINRRKLLQRSLVTTLSYGAGLTILANAKSARATPANEKITMAVIGCRGRGKQLMVGLASRADCQFKYLADVDSSLFEARGKTLADAQDGRKPECRQDFRTVLDDASVDAVVIATPDHWHVPAAIMACQAGKDVYVEKPLSHNCWEGRQTVEAARRNNRIVQVGTQNRSAPYNMAAKKYIEDGKLGTIHLCRVFNQKEWANFPAVPDSAPPQGLDWEMWNGPAPEHQYNAAIHKNWHHFWNYSGGDIVNDGIHQLDLARWLCGVEYPKSVYSTGARFDKEGAAETPDNQVATFEFDKLLMTFTLTLDTPYMLKSDPELRDNDIFPHWPQNATRIEIYGSEGVMFVGRMGGGWQVFERTKGRQPVVTEQMYGRFPDPNHQENFVDCIRSRELPNADVEKGHRSALLGHLANISYRLGGRKLVFDGQSEQIVDDSEAMKFYTRESYRAPYGVKA